MEKENNEIINSTVDAPIEDPTLATTDEVIPAPVEDTIPEDPNAIAPVECPGCNGSCGDSCSDDCIKSNVTVANIFGTLQECVTITWRLHLKTRKHHIHVTLNEFYDKALDIVDDIIEQYQGIYGVVEDTFTNCIVSEGKSESEYLTELKTFIENNRCVLGNHSEINSTIDEFLALIDSTIYKITSFCENQIKSFDEFVYEDYTAIKEACCHNKFGERYSDDPDDPDYDPDFAEEEE